MKTQPQRSRVETHSDDIAEMPADALRARQKEIFDLLDQIDAKMRGAVELDEAARERAQRLRGRAEKEAIESILDYADARPESFAHFADRDRGHDPGAFETALLRDRLEGALIMAEIVDRLDSTRQKVSDSSIYLTSLVKPVALAAFEVARPLARIDKKNGEKLSSALNFYGAIDRGGAKARAQKKSEPEE
jgi:hypothetical protein